MSYYIVEGMPGCGKSTIAQELKKELNGVYCKSIVSDSNFGKLLKSMREDTETELTEFFYSIDLLLDELKIQHLISVGKTVIRDKSIISSIAHQAAQGCLIKDPKMKLFWDAMREEMMSNYSFPDAIIVLNFPLEMIIKRFSDKKDYSRWDQRLVENPQLYRQQGNALFVAARIAYPGCKIIEISNGEQSVSECVEDILNRL